MTCWCLRGVYPTRWQHHSLTLKYVKHVAQAFCSFEWSVGEFIDMEALLVIAFILGWLWLFCSVGSSKEMVYIVTMNKSLSGLVNVKNYGLILLVGNVVLALLGISIP